MLNEETFVIQTLNSNLYYLRTLREFAANIQLSFLYNNTEYIDTAKDFGDRCEALGNILMKYANGNVSKEALDNHIFVTKYTLDCELLTEKLFPIDIDTSITEKQLQLGGGKVSSPSQEMIDELKEVNQSALILVTNFIDFCKTISEKLNNKELFSYSYISMIEAMLVEANLYQLTLNRIIARDNISPTFIVDYEYLFSSLLQKYSSFIRGLVDPRQSDIIVRAASFSSEFGLIASEYKKAVISPDVQDDLIRRSLEIVTRFITFISEIIESVLNDNTYFIVEPTFLDNILTTTNYFKYALFSTS